MIRSSLNRQFNYSGSQIGTCVSNIVGGYILEYAPGCAWKLVFYVFGSCGIIWYVLWQFLCYNDPQSHPFISEEEKIYLQKEIGCFQRKKVNSVYFELSSACFGNFSNSDKQLCIDVSYHFAIV